MEDIDGMLLLREKLLSAGIDEILAHGVRGFSLRRVAAACGASCAAPYKHFKNKEEFVKEIMAYVEEKWQKLSQQISCAFDDPARRITELCIANVRFKIANPLYGLGSDRPFSPEITCQIEDYCKNTGCKNTKEYVFIISALTWGTASLIESGKMDNSAENLDLLREQITKVLTSE